MSNILQHLKAPELPSVSTAARDYAVLVDLERRVSLQSAGQDIVRDRDGGVFIVPITIPAVQGEMESFDPLQPSTLIPAAGWSESVLKARSAALTNRISSLESGMAPLNMISDLHEVKQVTGLFAGFELMPFQVGHLGGDVWQVEGGQVKWNVIVRMDDETGNPVVEQRSAQITGRDVNISKGLICIALFVTPTSDGPPNGYNLDPGPIQTMGSFTNQPPRRSIEPKDEQSNSIRWEAGTIYAPIAHVTAPSANGSPRILYMLGKKDILVTTVNYGPGPLSFA